MKKVMLTAGFGLLLGELTLQSCEKEDVSPTGPVSNNDSLPGNGTDSLGGNGGGNPIDSTWNGGNGSGSTGNGGSGGTSSDSTNTGGGSNPSDSLPG